MNIKQDLLWRVWLTFGLLTLFAAGVLFFAFKIQVIEGERWRGLSDSLVTYKNIEATRGNIFDCNENLLATSIPIYEVRLDLNADGVTDALFREKIDSLCLMLSQLFQDKSAAQYKSMLTHSRDRGDRYFLLKDKLDYNYIKALKTFPILRAGRYKGGFMVEQQSMRLMPFRNLAKRTIGYKNEDDTKVGLEGAFDTELSGKTGKRLMRKLSGGIWMPINDENEIEPENGKDLLTTLDVNLQDVAEHALISSLEKNKADHGCAILMEVATGEIKALANIRRRGEGNYVEDFNYAIGDNTEPGSTFKVISVMSMLEDGLVALTDSTSTEGGEKKYSDRVMRDAEAGGYGIVSLQKAFEKSSNVAISKFMVKAYAKNPSRFTDHLIALGLNKKLGLQIQGEALPIVKTPNDRAMWNGNSLPWMSIGYEVAVSPMQMITVYNAIANNGKMLKPLLVKQIKSIGSDPEDIKATVLNEKICSDATLKKLHLIMAGVVDHGTAQNLKNKNYTIAGKTGTAQVAKGNQGYSQGVYQSSFAGFFPADNPKYTCIVVIRNPTAGVYYGSLVAGPVFKDIADKVYSLNIQMQNPVNDSMYVNNTIPNMKSGAISDFLNISKAMGFKYRFADADEGSDFVQVTKDDTAYAVSEVRIHDKKIPNVIGMSIRDALYVLENQGFQVGFQGSGKVVEQNPSAGTPYIKNSTVQIRLE